MTMMKVTGNCFSCHHEGKERTVFMDSDPYSNTAWNRRSAVAPVCLMRA